MKSKLASAAPAAACGRKPGTMPHQPRRRRRSHEAERSDACGRGLTVVWGGRTMRKCVSFLLRRRQQAQTAHGRSPGAGIIFYFRIEFGFRPQNSNPSSRCYFDSAAITGSLPGRLARRAFGSGVPFREFRQPAVGSTREPPDAGLLRDVLRDLLGLRRRDQDNKFAFQRTLPG